MLDRHQARSAAFQTLFMLESSTDLTPDAAISEVLTTTQNKKDDQLVQLNLTDPNQVYLQQLVKGVVDQQAELDQSLTPKLKGGWTLKRLSKTDLLILRLGLFEIENAKVPQAVAINEAIQLAKEFSDDSSAKFINGVLAKFIKADSDHQ
ncbi:MAG TPA: transcription antitermination factor NusB [Lapidilactobacillus dextrinicus]|jgi:N utilization substance protein B|uniref:Transcription antitermination protein NusB n=1 Tax=Lapidilactobacillus dextrinicus TaxID=51664 RepID=A0A921DUL8_9LACO|nr:transcription antitermination factor NusB [Lapidilactobacillus dextrinicus]